MIDIKLQRDVRVEGIFKQFGTHFGAKATQYGGTLGGAAIGGNTILAVLCSGKGGELERTYLVNPHAGEFATVADQVTRHITVYPLTENAASEQEIREILEGLK